MRLIDFDKIPFLDIPIAPVVKGESVHYEKGALKEWFDGTQDVEAVPLDRIKEAKDAVENINPIYSTIGNRIPVLKNCDDIKTEVLAILDKLIAEVGEEE